MKKKFEYITIPQLAQKMGVSRIAVYKWVKSGKITAFKIGRTYAIPQDAVSVTQDEVLNDTQKKIVDDAVTKTVKEYGETLRLLGRE